MKNIPLVNIYNFVRQSHIHPSVFIEDDFETLKNQLIVLKYYGLPSTVALKYDALMNDKYQDLLKEYLDEKDEIGAWLEITDSLCERAGVKYNASDENEYDHGINRIYSVGYEPKDRIKLIDVYMEDFYKIYSYYPRTIGSWVLDEVTLIHAKEKYGIKAACICRDQLGTDGFYLWGGYSSGPYFPSKTNIFLPAKSPKDSIGIPVFRLLGPDPIYNQEEGQRPGMHGVYTFEPASITGRGDFIKWYFDWLTNDKSMGLNYLQIGQENNFLWPNIKPGFIDQIKLLKDLVDDGKVGLETMGQSGEKFIKTFVNTPPASTIVDRDWNEENGLEVINYNSRFYRISFIKEEGRVRIRDFFVYNDEKSIYLSNACPDNLAVFKAPAILNPQGNKYESRPYIKFYKDGMEIEGEVSFFKNQITIGDQAKIYLEEDRLEIEGDIEVLFDYDLMYYVNDKEVVVSDGDFKPSFNLEYGDLVDGDRLKIRPDQKRICIRLGQGEASKACQYELESDLKYEINPSLEAEFKALVDTVHLLEGDEEDQVLPVDAKFTGDIDQRPVFVKDYMRLFENRQIGSEDYIDESWLASKANLEIDIDLGQEIELSKVYLNFLFNHRQGIVYPKAIRIYDGDDLLTSLDLEGRRPGGEIGYETFELGLDKKMKSFKIRIENYQLQPDWAFYRGTSPVFNLLNLIYIKRG